MEIFKKEIFIKLVYLISRVLWPGSDFFKFSGSLCNCKQACHFHEETFSLFLGKSTLMDSLFNTSFEAIPQNHREPTVRLDSHTYELEESNVKLKLSICDTVGYGDQVNKQDRYTVCLLFITWSKNS